MLFHIYFENLTGFFLNFREIGWNWVFGLVYFILSWLWFLVVGFEKDKFFYRKFRCRRLFEKIIQFDCFLVKIDMKLKIGSFFKQASL